MGLSIVDLMTGLFAAFALVSGVLTARETGKGRDLDVSLFDTALQNLCYLVAGRCRRRERERALPRRRDCRGGERRRGVLPRHCGKGPRQKQECQQGEENLIGRRLDEDEATRGDEEPQRRVLDKGRGKRAAAAVKRLARRLHAWLIGVLALEQREGRRGEDVEVENQRPVLDVVEVMLDALLDLLARVGLAAPAVDLRPAGDPGLDPVAGEIAVDHLVVEPVAGLGLQGVRPRADQREVALERR